MTEEMTYERCFPGRFTKAAFLNGRKVTVTITKAYMEVLEGDKGEQNKLIMAFKGAKMELVVNKTNAFCMKEMFGNKVADWIGKRIIIYPTKVAFGPKQVDAIRIAGSPDIPEDIEVSARIGRKMFKTTLRKGDTNHAPAPPPTAAPETHEEDMPDFDFELDTAPQHLEDDNA